MNADVAVAPVYAIETHDLRVWYGEFLALKDVTIHVRRGAVTSLIGPSGCGKTTLLRCVNRLNERYGHVRTAGLISVLGNNIYAPDVNLGELRKQVGMVFQRPNPLPLSIYENVMFGLRIHSEGRGPGGMSSRDVVESALTAVALWDDVKDRLHANALSLSLEQQQKLCIARLLPLKPQVILMDEPCSALDARGTAAIETLIASLGPAYTVLIVTHNMAQARRASDDCVFMLLGEVVEYGSTLDIFLRPQQRQTELYVGGRYG
jgi:phosphate transport system ATP-binding protein